MEKKKVGGGEKMSLGEKVSVGEKKEEQEVQGPEDREKRLKVTNETRGGGTWLVKREECEKGVRKT